MKKPHRARSRVHTRHIPMSETVEAWLFIISIFFSIWFVQSGVIGALIAYASGVPEVASAFVGMFYTSILTTAPAMVAFAELGSTIPLWKIAVFGSLGAVTAELLMFRFVRSPLVEHVLDAAFHPFARRVGRGVASGSFWWIAPVVGLFVIGSPLPDELGLLMLGLSQLRLVQFIPLALAANMLGIYAIAFLPQLIAGA